MNRSARRLLRILMIICLFTGLHFSAMATSAQAAPDDGFCTDIMHILGDMNKAVELGSHFPIKNHTYPYPTVWGKKYTYTYRVNPTSFFNRRFRDLPLLTTYGQAANFEAPANLSLAWCFFGSDLLCG